MSTPNPADLGELVARICIGLFADYDDLSLESAEYNWRVGLGYGAVGSAGHAEIVKTANLVAEAVSPIIAAQQRDIEGLKRDQSTEKATWNELVAERDAAEARAEALEKERDALKGHIACMEAGHAESREQFSEARDRLQAELHANITRATKAEAEVAALRAKLDRAAEALGPFAKEGRIIGSMLVFTPAPGSRQSAFMEAAAVHAELTQEGGNV